MIDRLGRKIHYLRVSVTKRCNLNCTYCGTREEKTHELSPEEIEKLVRGFSQCGITKVRLTGGEPLVRKDICDIARRISRIEGIKKLAITTNGINLKQYAKDLRDAGVTAVNVSLDTTDREKYKQLTGYDGLGKVFEGIEECERVGISSIRLNAVLIRGDNDSSAASLIDIARKKSIDVRFIELMPFSDEGEKESAVIKGDEILEAFPFLKPVVTEKNTSDKSVARYYTAEGFKGRIGLITPVSNRFCSECNRIRLLSDGKVKPCLGNEEIYDLMPLIDNEEELRKEIERIIYNKPDEHSFSCAYADRHGLNRIGG